MEINRQLHAERIVRGTHRRRVHRTSWVDLAPGSYVVVDDVPAVVLDESVVPWTTTGYAEPRARPRRGTVDALTPPSTLAALRAGYPAQIDDGAVRAG
jgi:hypothetical protein